MGVGERVAVGSGLGVGVRVGEAVAVGSSVGVGVGVGEREAVGSGVAVGAGVGVAVGSGVCVGETVGVAVSVRVAVAVGSGVDVGVAVGVAVSSGDRLPHAKMARQSRQATSRLRLAVVITSRVPSRLRAATSDKVTDPDASLKGTRGVALSPMASRQAGD